LIRILFGMDNIELLAQRAAAGLPLFDEDTNGREVVESEYWIAPNGFRHLLRVVYRINGQLVEVRRQPPWLNPLRQARIAHKKMQYDKYFRNNPEFKKRECERKRRAWLKKQAEKKRLKDAECASLLSEKQDKLDIILARPT
jgi:hypothetical protein